MKKAVAIGFVLCLLWRANANAQAIKNGLSGTIVSASVAVASGSTATIYTTPATGHFVLTEVGSATGLAGVDCGPLLFSASGFGPIAELVSAGTSAGLASFAHQFTPGLALPAGSQVGCHYEGTGCPASDCYVTGVLEKK